jgi:hypothetical protein
MENAEKAEIKTVPELIDQLGGPAQVSRDLGFPGPSTVSEMKRRGSIQVRHWPGFVELAKRKGILGVNNDALVAMHLPAVI